jgi:predicted amidophosphoribosyltransferase
MGLFLICSNPRCHFVLDKRVNGSSLDGVESILTKCPSCGGKWSTICPSCGLPLAVDAVAGRFQRICCEVKAPSDAGTAAQPPAAPRLGA